MEVTSLRMSLGTHVFLLCSVCCGHVLYVGHVEGSIGGKSFLVFWSLGLASAPSVSNPMMILSWSCSDNMHFNVSRIPKAGVLQRDLTLQDLEGAKTSSDCSLSSGAWNHTMVIHIQIRTRITLVRAQVLIH